MSTARVSVDWSSKRQLNTSVLQKINSNVLEVIEDASQAVVYNFVGGKWEKGSCEGAIFLTRNCMKPYNTLMILNKMGLENFALEVCNIMNMKLQEPYVMIKFKDTATGQPKIAGLWFHDSEERDSFFGVLSAVQQSQQTAPAAAMASVSVGSSENKESANKTGALMSLLSVSGNGAAAAAAAAAPAAPAAPAPVVRNEAASESKSGGTKKPKKPKKDNKEIKDKKNKEKATTSAPAPATAATITPNPPNHGTSILKGLLSVKAPASDADAMTALTKNLIGGGVDSFTDRGISSVQRRADFEVPEGIDSEVATKANQSYREATRDSAKAEATIPAHHLAAGGVGSAFFFADTDCAAPTPPPLPPADTTPPPMSSVGVASAGSKTSLLKSMLSGSKSTSPAPPTTPAGDGPPLTHVRSLDVPRPLSTGSITKASSMTSLSNGSDTGTGSAQKSVASPRASAAFLSPSDLMKMMGK